MDGKNSCDDQAEPVENSVSQFKFELNLVDPCEVATIIIDQKIVAQNIYYGIYEGNTPTEIFIDPEMINFSPQSTHCPVIVLDVVNLDGTQI